MKLMFQKFFVLQYTKLYSHLPNKRFGESQCVTLLIGHGDTPSSILGLGSTQTLLAISDKDNYTIYIMLFSNKHS